MEDVPVMGFAPFSIRFRNVDGKNIKLANNIKTHKYQAVDLNEKSTTTTATTKLNKRGRGIMRIYWLFC